MDMKRTGAFLKELRKEKGLTQEQLAVYLNVSGRTVSRWETGNNLPDLDVLIILSDYYKVEIRELIDGERHPEKKDKKQEETILKIADYSQEKEKILLRRIIGIVISCIASWCLSLAVMLRFLNEVTDGILALIFLLVSFLLYSLLVFSKKTNRTGNGYLISLIGLFAASVVSNLLLILIFFGNGSYQNYGMVGVYYALGIFITTFISVGIITTIINKKAFENSKH